MPLKLSSSWVFSIRQLKSDYLALHFCIAQGSRDMRQFKDSFGRVGIATDGASLWVLIHAELNLHIWC